MRDRLRARDRHGRVDPTHTVNIVIDATTLAGGFDPHGRSDIPGFGAILPSRVRQLLCALGREVVTAKS